MPDRTQNRGRYGNFTAEEGGRVGNFDRNSREGSFGGNRDDRYGNYNRRINTRDHDNKPPAPVVGMYTYTDKLM